MWAAIAILAIAIALTAVLYGLLTIAAYWTVADKGNAAPSDWDP